MTGQGETMIKDTNHVSPGFWWIRLNDGTVTVGEVFEQTIIEVGGKQRNVGRIKVIGSERIDPVAGYIFIDPVLGQP